MTSSNPGALHVRAKANQVVDYHYDDTRPGKPLYLLIPGGLIALASLALIIYLAYLTWFDESLDQGTGLGLILLLAPFYIGGVFLFSYGYELYDLRKALRDTAIVVFITVAAVVIIAVLGVVAGSLGGGGGKSSSESSSNKSSRSSSSSSSGSNSSTSSVTSASTSSSSGGGDWLGNTSIFIGSSYPHTVTHEVTHEVVREVPTAPPAPVPIKCPNCGRSYIPADNHFACPNCGAPTSQELIQESSGASSLPPGASAPA